MKIDATYLMIFLFHFKTLTEAIRRHEYCLETRSTAFGVQYTFKVNGLKVKM